MCGREDGSGCPPKCFSLQVDLSLLQGVNIHGHIDLAPHVCSWPGIAQSKVTLVVFINKSAKKRNQATLIDIAGQEKKEAKENKYFKAQN